MIDELINSDDLTYCQFNILERVLRNNILQVESRGYFITHKNKNREINETQLNPLKTLTTATNKDRKQYLSRASPITGAVNETSSPDVPPLLVRPFRIQNGAVSGVTSPPAILSARAPLTGNGSE